MQIYLLIPSEVSRLVLPHFRDIISNAWWESQLNLRDKELGVNFNTLLTELPIGDDRHRFGVFFNDPLMKIVLGPAY